MTKQMVSVLLLVLTACAATPESEERRWSNNQTDAGKMQTMYPNMTMAISKLQMDATAKYNEAKTKSGNAQLQDMQQANKIIEQILYPIRDYERELQEAQRLISSVPTAAPVLTAAVNNAKMALSMVNNADSNVAIGAFRGAYDQIKPIVDWAEQVKAGKNPPMPTVPGMSAMPMGIPGATPGMGVPGAVPGGAPGAVPGGDIPGAVPGAGTPGVMPTNGGPGENPGAVPGTPGAIPGAEVPGVPPAGGPGGN